MECGNVGMLECWNVGMLECYNVIRFSNLLMFNNVQILLVQINCQNFKY